jgi:hypothetical protein
MGKSKVGGGSLQAKLAECRKRRKDAEEQVSAVTALMDRLAANLAEAHDMLRIKHLAGPAHGPADCRVCVALETWQQTLTAYQETKGANDGEGQSC